MKLQSSVLLRTPEFIAWIPQAEAALPTAHSLEETLADGGMVATRCCQHLSRNATLVPFKEAIMRLARSFMARQAHTNLAILLVCSYTEAEGPAVAAETPRLAADATDSPRTPAQPVCHLLYCCSSERRQPGCRLGCHLQAVCKATMAVHCHQHVLHTGSRCRPPFFDNSNQLQIALRPGDTPMSPSKVSPADFQVLKVVGQGAFGKVGTEL